MILKIDNKIIKVEVEELQSIISKHTGNELEILSCSVRTRGERNNQSLLKLINKAKDSGVEAIDEEDNILKKFGLDNSSYMYSGEFDDDTLFTHTFKLKEKEVLNLDMLIINGIAVKPFEYEEKFDDEDLIIKTKIKLEGDQIQQFIVLEEGEKYFNVIRKGISDKPISMRFGKTIWSEHEGFIKKDITLVQESYDSRSNNFKGIFYPEIYNMMDIIAFTKNFAKELTDILVNKNLLTKEEVEELREKAIKNENSTRRLFYKVTDIDKE